MYDEWVTEIPGKEVDAFTMPVAPLDVNAVFLVSKKTKEAILVDPGGEADELQAFIKHRGLILRQVILTHAHFDHVTAVDEMLRFILENGLDSGPGLALHPEDLFLLERVGVSASRFGIAVSEIQSRPELELKDGLQLETAGISITVIHTPGHSPGSCSFYLPAEGLLLTGDTLFQGGVGRTDLPGGSLPVLKDSIQRKLYSLPDGTRVIPGHGEMTTIGEEKSFNPFIRFS